jgi:hypothetical protein
MAPTDRIPPGPFFLGLRQKSPDFAVSVRAVFESVPARPGLERDSDFLNAERIVTAFPVFRAENG